MSLTIPATQKAIRIHEHGGPEVIKYEQIPVPEISESQVLVKNNYAGVNFADTYRRNGATADSLPLTLGYEGTGVVVKVGSKVSKFSIGDKVAYIGAGYAEYTLLEAGKGIVQITTIPDGIDERQIEGGIAQGLTALGLTTQAIPIKKGDYVLVHAAAGGTGALVVQYAKKFGAIVIGTTSTEEKANFVKQLGADYIINYKTEDVVARVKEITNGVGVSGVFDGIGKDTWKISLDCTTRGGKVAYFGVSSGIPPSIPFFSIDRNISISFPRFSNFYSMNDSEFELLSKEFLNDLKSGAVKLYSHKHYKLSETSQAINDLESGTTIGKLVIDIN